MSTISDSLPANGSIPKLLLRTEEAAHALGISRSQVYHLIQAQRLESVRVGGARRIPLACLNAYVDDLRRERGEVAR